MKVNIKIALLNKREKETNKINYKIGAETLI